MERLANLLPDLAADAVEVQRQLDDDWAFQIRALRQRFGQDDLAESAMAQALEVRLRPPRPFLSTFGVTLQTDVVQNMKREGGVEFRPLNAGYRAAFGITATAHCQIEFEVRQSPVAPPTGSDASPGPGSLPNSQPT